VARELMEAEITGEIGAGRGEIAPVERLTHRNGYRPRCGRRGLGRSSC
jgi:transposase-like protein